MNSPVQKYKNDATVATEKFPAMLEKFKNEISRALPKHMSGDRLARVALTEFRKNPKLADCDPRSVFAAVIMGSQLGLEPGILGQSYLVPYGKVCQFIPGWQGLVDLVSRTGRATTWTGAVFRGDEFDFAKGDRPFIHHKPMGEEDPAAMSHVYSVGRVNGCEWPVIEVWSVQKVLQHRDKYNKVGKSHYSFAHPEMYARKVPLLQIVKYMPKSVELATAVELEYAGEKGAQRLDMGDAIQGTWNYEEDSSSAALPTDNAETSGAPNYTDVAAALKGAQNKDQLNEAYDLAREVKNSVHREQLDALYQQRESELK